MFWLPHRGISSAGRALRSHRRGQGFESPILHLPPRGRGRARGPAQPLLPVNWTPQAESRLKEVPFFVRPVVRRRIESLAAEAGRNAVDETFYEQAKAQFGQK